MAKRVSPVKFYGERGYTLIELMVAAGLGGLVFYTLMALLGQTANFATFFHSGAGAIEASSDAISLLNGIMPQVVRVKRCGCSGAVGTAAASCVWSAPTSTDPNIGKDPVQSYNVALPGVETLLFEGDFESFGGNIPATPLSTMQGLYTANIGSAGIVCDSTLATAFSGSYPVNPKGCKQQVQLYYTSPTIELGATPSKSGVLRICVGSGCTTPMPAPPATDGSNTFIGPSSFDASTGDSRRTTVGVTQLSCGFVQNASSPTNLFVLNMKIKSRATTEQTVASSSYESWWPAVAGTNGGLAGKNFTRGTVRDLRFKFAFRNLSNRGMYQWRVQGKRNCIANGFTVSNKSDCCSLAATGASSPFTCAVCKASGVAAANAGECCSETLDSGGSNCL